MAGFTYKKSLAGTADPLRKFQMVASGAIVKGDLLEFTNGKIGRVNAQADSAPYVAEESATSDATSVVMVTCRSTQKGLAEFDVGITPLVDLAACASNASLTTVKLPLTDGSSSDLVGGSVYIRELNQQRVITANTYSSNVVTITVAEPFTSAPTTGMYGSIWAGGVGMAGKLHASTMYNTLSNVIADARSGGKAIIQEIDLKNKTISVTIDP